MLILKLIWKYKGPRILKKTLILKIGKKIAELGLPDFKPYYKTMVIMKIWH